MLVLLSVLVVGETVKGPLPNDGETGPAAKGWASVLNTTVKQKKGKIETVNTSITFASANGTYSYQC